MAHVLRDYGPDGVSVVLASNGAGRVEPFVFSDRAAAERAADQFEGKGDIETVLVWHGVELLDEHAAQRFAFGLRGFEGRDEETS